MVELREELLTLLKEIDYICKKYDITYYAEGGTIIGALRHNGFIPWDDDMDLVMTRDNFYKFVDAFKKEKLPDRVLECPDTNSKYPLVTIKYNDTSTTTIFRSLMNNICACGAYIDIFILDPIPKGREDWFKSTFLSYTELLCPYYVINDAESSRKQYKKDLKRVKKYGRDKVLEDYRNKLFCYKEEDCDEYLIRWGIAYQTVRIEDYGEPRYVPFEGIMLPLPCRAERILTNFFGDDWYIIPKVDNQITHNVVQNLNCSYKYYQKDYMRFINKDAYMKNVCELKRLRMAKKDMEVYNSRQIYVLNSFRDSLSLQSKLDKDKIISLYKENKFNELEADCDLFFNAQDRGIYKRNNITLDIDLDICYYLFRSAINIGTYYNVSYIIDLFVKKDKNKFMDIYDEVYRLREAKELYFEKRYDEALEIVNELFESNQYNSSAYKIKLDIILNNEDLDYESLLDEIRELYKYTGDIELYKYEGDIYLALGNREKARACYDEVINNSRNGLLLLDISKKMK